RVAVVVNQVADAHVGLGGDRGRAVVLAGNGQAVGAGGPVVDADAELARLGIGRPGRACPSQDEGPSQPPRPPPWAPSVGGCGSVRPGTIAMPRRGRQAGPAACPAAEKPPLSPDRVDNLVRSV